MSYMLVMPVRKGRHSVIDVRDVALKWEMHFALASAGRS